MKTIPESTTKKITKKTSLLLRLLILLLLCNTSIFAYNHSEIDWRSVSTKNFIIHFYDKTEPAVYATWKVAEEAYTVYASLYNYNTRQKIHITLAEYDDYSNGYASWTDRSIMIWVPESGFNLRSNSTYLRNIITHELGHIMSLEKGRGMQLLDWSLGLQYNSKNIDASYLEPFAFTTFFPDWFAEGTAQLRSEEMGNDCWDNRRDMVLRCAALDKKMLSFDEMGHFTHNGLGNEMVYNQGYSFTKFLENQIGKEKIARIWNDSRDRDLFSTSLAKYLKKNHSLSLSDLFNQWKKSVLAEAKSNTPTQMTKTDPVWKEGLFNDKPKISPDGRLWGWLTSHKDDYFRTDLIIAEYGKTIPLKRIKYAHTDWDFSPDGNTVYYIKSRNSNRDGSFFNDIFSYSFTNDKEMQLSKSARIYSISVSTDGKQLACVQYKGNSFSVVLFILDDKKYKTIVSGVAGEPFQTISYLPSDNNKLVVSKVVQGKAGLFTIDIAAQTIKALISTDAQEENPYCATDGRIYYSADYDGVFNIYSLLPDGTDIKRHSTLIGGAFSPIVDKNGKLFLSEYTSDGFAIAKCVSSNTVFNIPQTSTCTFRSLPEPTGNVKINSNAYEAKTLRPYWEILTGVICTDTNDALQDMITNNGEPYDSTWDIGLDIFTEILLQKSDAVGQKHVYIGGAVYLVANWDSDNKETDTSMFSQAFAPKPYTNSHLNFNARPGFLRRQEQKRYGYISPLVKRDMRLSNETLDKNDTSKTESTFNTPFLIPIVGYESHKFKPTIGIDAQFILSGMVPAMIYLDPYIELRLNRDLYIGASPNFSISPILLFMGETVGFGMSFPLWVNWDYHRYINEDISYNNAGRTTVSGYLGPEIEPYIEIDNTDTISDTTLETMPTMAFSVQFKHSFPFFKYSSFSISTEIYEKIFGEKLAEYGGITDSLDSKSLFATYDTIAFTFPIFRNINRGKLYTDNIYGSIFYGIHFASSGKFMSEPKGEIFYNKDYYSPYASVSHIIGMGIETGFIKNYMFGRKLKSFVAWDLFKKEYHLNISMMF